MINYSAEKVLYDINTLNHLTEPSAEDDFQILINFDEKSSIFDFKRVFDIIFSFLVLLLLGPAFAIIALAIKIISPDGPVFFGHTRIGLNGKEFKCYKFRTMVPDAENVIQELIKNNKEAREEFEKDFKLKNDPRIIPVVGNFLRKCSLDELPQFFNVFIGDMSVVGPRPIIHKEKIKYGRNIDKLLSIKPGITGLWQVSGRNNVSYNRRVAFDRYYVNNSNLWLDIKIILKTVSVMLNARGAY